MYEAAKKPAWTWDFLSTPAYKYVFDLCGIMKPFEVWSILTLSVTVEYNILSRKCEKLSWKRHLYLQQRERKSCYLPYETRTHRLIKKMNTWSLLSNTILDIMIHTGTFPTIIKHNKHWYTNNERNVTFIF